MNVFASVCLLFVSAMLSSLQHAFGNVEGGGSGYTIPRKHLSEIILGSLPAIFFTCEDDLALMYS